MQFAGVIDMLREQGRRECLIDRRTASTSSAKGSDGRSAGVSVELCILVWSSVKQQKEADR